jgi:hypothetical protein
MIWQVKGQHPVGTTSMSIVDLFSTSEKLVKQSNQYTCHICTDSSTQGLCRVCKSGISPGWICV